MMNVWGITDTGLVRHENQDAYAVRVCEDSGFTVCVVCDGMGGPGGGKLASELAVEAFLSGQPVLRRGRRSGGGGGGFRRGGGQHRGL